MVVGIIDAVADERFESESTARPVSLWRQISDRWGPGAVAGRYTTLVRLRAGRTDQSTLTATAREDTARLATALGAILDLHAPDARHRCKACSGGPQLVHWPCRTRRAAEDGLRHGWAGQSDGAGDTADDGSMNGDPHECFSLAVLAAHRVLPEAGGQPARCQICQVPPNRCPVWTLAESFLGITWAD